MFPSVNEPEDDRKTIVIDIMFEFVRTCMIFTAHALVIAHMQHQKKNICQKRKQATRLLHNYKQARAT